MASSGTASPISRDDAVSLLQKFITESTRVQVMFVGRGGVNLALQGTVSFPQEGTVLVSMRREPTDASLVFGLKDVSKFLYGDNRAFPGSSGIPGTPHLSSALCFVYPDGAQIAIFEIR